MENGTEVLIKVRYSLYHYFLLSHLFLSASNKVLSAFFGVSILTRPLEMSLNKLLVIQTLPNVLRMPRRWQTRSEFICVNHIFPIKCQTFMKSLNINLNFQVVGVFLDKITHQSESLNLIVWWWWLMWRTDQGTSYKKCLRIR